mmetsp:Transcript_26571/g.58236  ORF Transcript_26571/g.58236 Transcript_26571/m.58236 type:complete len:196 (-) Transcript_26571:129-716(-)
MSREREVVLHGEDVIGHISIGSADTRDPRCWVLAEVRDSPATQQGLIHRNDVLVKIDGKELPEEGQGVAEKLTELSDRPQGVKVVLRSPTANDFMHNRPVPHDLMQEYLGDTFGFEENKEYNNPSSPAGVHHYKWTGGHAAAVYKALVFCKSCSAIWWVHHQTLWYNTKDELECPSCESCEGGSKEIVLSAAPNC